MEPQKIGALVSRTSTESLTAVIQNDISLYTGELTNECVKDNFKRLSLCFPKMKQEFFVILHEYLLKDNFTDQRLIDATDHLIKNNVYPEIVPGSILGYDKRIKLKTYEDIVLEGNKIYPGEPGKMFNVYRKFKKIDYEENGEKKIRFLYASIADIEIYGLKTLE